MPDYPMSAECRQQIVEPSEGHGPKKPGGFACYRDCVGVSTGGYGHTAMAGPPIPVPGEVWSPAKCDAVLEQDLKKWARELAPYFDRAAKKRVVLQREIDAIIDLYHNCGRAILSSTLLRLYVAGAPSAQVATHFNDWVKAGGRVVAGLVARRQRDTAWFLDGRLARTTVSLIGEADALPMAHLVDHPNNLAARAYNCLRLAA